MKYCLFVIAFLTSFNALAQSYNLPEAFANGKVQLNMRYRYEFVDQKYLDNANASTLRTAISYQTDQSYNANAFIEIEDVSELGPRRYNDGVNGYGNFAAVKDPKGTEINQLYVSYPAPFSSKIKIGRQELTVNTRRFFGNSPWRNNHRSMDGVMISNNYFNDLDLTYAFIRRVNTTLGKKSPVGVYNNTNINLFNANYAGIKNFKIILYGFLVDIKDPTETIGIFAKNSSASNKTFGGRVEYDQVINHHLAIATNLEYANQSSYAGNPVNYNVNYLLIEPSITYKKLTLKFSYEELGSDGNISIVNVLGNKHGFNGFADKFTNIPINGLKDFSGLISYQYQFANQYLQNISSFFGYHQFYSDKKSVNYGSEYDFVINNNLNKNYSIGLKVAYYDAQNFGVNTTKIMLFSELKF